MQDKISNFIIHIRIKNIDVTSPDNRRLMYLIKRRKLTLGKGDFGMSPSPTTSPSTDTFKVLLH